MSLEILQNVWPEWEVLRLLGRGSYGVVYEAARNENGLVSRSAIKIIEIPTTASEVDALQSEGLTDAQTRDYLRDIVNEVTNEIRIMESFKGKDNIVSVEDFRVIEDPDHAHWTILIRMELLTPLTDYLKNNEMTEAEVIKLGRDLCTALELCEQQGLIHRDIKPENIFINRFGDFKLGDFGVARRLESTTVTLSMKGTRSYMAPEVERGEPYGSNVDLYSLGLVLYRLTNRNRSPFLNPDHPVPTSAERMMANQRRLNGEPLPPPACASPVLSEVILTACEPDPSKRFINAAAMKKALSLAESAGAPRMDGTETIPARPRPQNRPASAPGRGRSVKKSRSPYLPVVLVSVCLAVLAIVLVVILTGKDNKNDEPETASTSSEMTAEAFEESPTAVPELTSAAAASAADQDEVFRVLQNAGDLAAAGDYDSAIQILDTALLNHPDSRELVTAKIEYQDAKEDEEKRKKQETPSATPTVSPVKVDYDNAVGIFYLKNGGKNLRSKPTYNSDLVLTIKSTSTKMYYFGEQQEGAGSDGLTYTWYKIFLEDGTTGWIRSDFVTTVLGEPTVPPTPEPEIVYVNPLDAMSIFYITDGEKNVRSEPSYYSTLVMTITDPSEPLYYFGESQYGPGSDGQTHLWHRIYLEDGSGGWIRSDLVTAQKGTPPKPEEKTPTPTEAPTETPTEEPAPMITYNPPDTEVHAVLAVKSCNVRSEPTHDSDKVTSLEDFTQTRFYGELEAGPGSDGKIHDWYRLYFDGGSGWVREEYIYWGMSYGAPREDLTQVELRKQPTYESELVATADYVISCDDKPQYGPDENGDDVLWSHVFLQEAENGIVIHGWVKAEELIHG